MDGQNRGDSRREERQTGDDWLERGLEDGLGSGKSTVSREKTNKGKSHAAYPPATYTEPCQTFDTANWRFILSFQWTFLSFNVSTFPSDYWNLKSWPAVWSTNTKYGEKLRVWIHTEGLSSQMSKQKKEGFCITDTLLSANHITVCSWLMAAAAAALCVYLDLQMALGCLLLHLIIPEGGACGEYVYHWLPFSKC